MAHCPICRNLLPATPCPVERDGDPRPFDRRRGSVMLADHDLDGTTVKPARVVVGSDGVRRLVHAFEFPCLGSGMRI